MTAAADVIPHLHASHWRQGRSAKAVADCWFDANDVPSRVRAVLDQVPSLRGAQLIDGFLERRVDLQDGRRTASQTDLLAILGLANGLAVMAVEAKVDEGFDKLVPEWLAEASVGKHARLARLRERLGLTDKPVDDLRYQLFHRSTSAILEARRYQSSDAIMLVHSFCPVRSGFEDYARFASRIGLDGVAPDSIAGPVLLDGVRLWMGWASDVCPPARPA